MLKKFFKHFFGLVPEADVDEPEADVEEKMSIKDIILTALDSIAVAAIGYVFVVMAILIFG